MFFKWVERVETTNWKTATWRNDRGQYKVYNMTLQGGHPLTQAWRVIFVWILCAVLVVYEPD